jgi:hypothetical protein
MSCRNSGDFDLDEGLRALRESTRDLEAPQRVEAVLLARRLALTERPAGQWRRWVLAAAATVVVAAGLSALMYKHRTRPAPVAPPPAPAARVEVAGQAKTPAVSDRGPRPTPRRVQPAVSAEITSGFIPLVPDPAWRPGESIQIMRVSMPRSALQSFGLPVDEDRAFEMVRADIVVGQDMVARAIRLVR